MKTLKEHMYNNLLPIFEVSSAFMKQAAQKQRDKLKDDDYLDSISAKRAKKLEQRANEFDKYAEKLHDKELNRTDYRLDKWHEWEDDRGCKPSIYTSFKINKGDLRGKGPQLIDKGNDVYTDLSKVTKLILTGHNHTCADSKRWISVWYDCDGEYGNREMLYEFLTSIASGKYTMKNEKVLKEMYDWAMNNDDDWAIYNIKQSDLADRWDDSIKEMGNPNGTNKWDSRDLFVILSGKREFIGTKEQKPKYWKRNSYKDWQTQKEKIYWGDHWDKYGLSISTDKTLDKYGISNMDECSDVRVNISDKTIDNLNITNVKDIRSYKAISHGLLDCAVLVLVDHLLDNDFSNVTRRAGNGYTFYTFSCVYNKEFDMDMIDKWKKAFGLGKFVTVDGNKLSIKWKPSVINKF